MQQADRQDRRAAVGFFSEYPKPASQPGWQQWLARHRLPLHTRSVSARALSKPFGAPGLLLAVLVGVVALGRLANEKREPPAPLRAGERAAGREGVG